MTDAEYAASMRSMTDLDDPAVLGPGSAVAVEAADAAARNAGVSIRELATLDELEAVYRLIDAVWRPDPSNPPVTTDLLRALAKAGNYVAGAFQGDRLVGACVGFFGAPVDGSMHSHIAGVVPELRGRNVGHALKLHQRAWALLRGATTISWTFDPLVSRNAYFNLVKLAAAPVEYLPNFYGGMGDGINGHGDSDRLLVRWQLDRLDDPGVSVRPQLIDAMTALSSTVDGWPVLGSTAGHVALVGVPGDVEALRRLDPDAAAAWRVAVREVLGSLMAAGGSVTGFDRAAGYIVTTAGTTAAEEATA